MNTIDINLRYHGIKLTPEYINYIRSKIIEIGNQSSGISSIDISLSKKEKQYQAVVSLISRRKKTIFVLHGSTCANLMYKLYGLIRKKIEHLKKSKIHQTKLLTFDWGEMYDHRERIN